MQRTARSLPGPSSIMIVSGGSGGSPGPTGGSPGKPGSSGLGREPAGPSGGSGGHPRRVLKELIGTDKVYNRKIALPSYVVFLFQ